MHCPRCGHQQNSDEIRFCTKCGLEMSNIKELLAPELRQTKAKRKSEIIKARRQGMIIMFSSFALILVFAALQEFFPLPKAFALIMFLFMVVGAIRMSMPSLFGKNDLANDIDELPEFASETNKVSGEQVLDKSLPEAEFRPPANFTAKNYDTSELVSPSNVTEDTTKNLKKEFQPE